MRISHENLNLLKTSEYREYQRLKKKEYTGAIIGCLGWIILHILLAPIAGFIVSGIAFLLNYGRNEIISAFYMTTILYLIPYVSIIFTAIVGETLNEKFDFESRFKELSKKRPSYKRFQQLTIYFEQVEIDIKNQVRQYVRGGSLCNLIEHIKNSNHDKREYNLLINDLKENHNFLKEVNSLTNIKSVFSVYKKKLRENDIWFEDELKEEEEKRKLRKIKEDALNTIRINSTIRNPSISENPLITMSYRKNKTAIGKQSQTKNNIHNQTSKSNTKNTKPNEALKPAISQKPEMSDKNGQLTLFEPEKKLTKPKLIKKKKQKLFKPRKIKASAKFWEDLNKKKMSIGKKGELLVLEYERKRIAREEGKEFSSYLEHSSVVQGDGLGHDILSIDIFPK